MWKLHQHMLPGSLPVGVSSQFPSGDPPGSWRALFAHYAHDTRRESRDHMFSMFCSFLSGSRLKGAGACFRRHETRAMGSIAMMTAS